MTRDADWATTERRTCSHHWVIQPADGPLSLGVCKFCRETRECGIITMQQRRAKVF